jgi:hypothetical protein
MKVMLALTYLKEGQTGAFVETPSRRVANRGDAPLAGAQIVGTPFAGAQIVGTPVAGAQIVGTPV